MYNVQSLLVRYNVASAAPKLLTTLEFGNLGPESNPHLLTESLGGNKRRNGVSDLPVQKNTTSRIQKMSEIQVRF